MHALVCVMRPNGVDFTVRKAVVAQVVAEKKPHHDNVWFVFMKEVDVLEKILRRLKAVYPAVNDADFAAEILRQRGFHDGRKGLSGRDLDTGAERIGQNNDVVRASVGLVRCPKTQRVRDDLILCPIRRSVVEAFVRSEEKACVDVEGKVKVRIEGADEGNVRAVNPEIKLRN
ncbi:MAG: hypothetical protein JO102_03585 [Elusimicrobia bacterium]|nr:hypothetical protein [Elusimicrobiota bacterium]